jgi:hypothetical protein
LVAATIALPPRKAASQAAVERHAPAAASASAMITVAETMQAASPRSVRAVQEFMRRKVPRGVERYTPCHDRTGDTLP